MSKLPVLWFVLILWNQYFESLAIPPSPTLIKWCFRYVDDVHNATRKDQVNKLQEHLNSIDPHIKFTIELPGTDGLPFLDTLTKPTYNSIESTVYTLTHRAKQVCSTHEFLTKEMDHLHKVLQDNHYPTQFFQQGKPQQKSNKKPNPSTVKFIEGARVVIAYIIGLSEQYRHTLAKYRVRVFFKVPAPSSPYSCIQKIQFQMHRKLI